MTHSDQNVAVITGGAGALGAAMASRFIAAGSRVVLVVHSHDALRRTHDSLASNLIATVVADVSTVSDTKRYVEFALDQFGHIDTFVANAGIEGAVRPIPDYPLETFDAVMQVNVRGIFLSLQHVLPIMMARGAGSIVIVSSVLGLKGAASGLAPYVASKHAAVGLMRAAALECAASGVRVNAIAPGFVEGPMMTRIVESVAEPIGEQFRERLSTLVPLGRYCSPDEVAELVMFLSRDASRFCTGTVFSIDGGMSAR